MNTYRPDQDSLNEWDQRIERVSNWLRQNLTRVVPAIGGLVVMIWLLSADSDLFRYLGSPHVDGRVNGRIPARTGK